MLRRVYDWMLRLAGRRDAEAWLGAVSFADSSFFPLPPDIMLAPMCMARPEKALRYAWTTTWTAVAGALLGYAIGYALFELIGRPLLGVYGYEAKFAEFAADIKANGFWWMLAFASLPIPYKVATIAAGSVQMDLVTLVVASFVGRGARFFLVAVLIKRYGEVAQRLIDEHFHKLALLFIVLFIGGFVVVKYAL